mgnify:CR=1 FL=1
MRMAIISMVFVGVLGLGLAAESGSNDPDSGKTDGNANRPFVLRMLSVIEFPPTFLRAGRLYPYFRL